MLKSNYEGQSVEQALQQGLKDLNVQEQQVRIDVINEGKKGIFGFMKQDARIELTIIDPELKEFKKSKSTKWTTNARSRWRYRKQQYNRR